jgi:hypothetical protein
MSGIQWPCHFHIVYLVFQQIATLSLMLINDISYFLITFNVFIDLSAHDLIESLRLS